MKCNQKWLPQPLPGTKDITSPTFSNLQTGGKLQFTKRVREKEVIMQVNCQSTDALKLLLAHFRSRSCIQNQGCVSVTCTKKCDHSGELILGIQRAGYPDLQPIRIIVCSQWATMSFSLTFKVVANDHKQQLLIGTPGQGGLGDIQNVAPDTLVR